MHCTDIAVCTITWARTDEEEATLVDALRCLAATGMPVAVADRDGRAVFTDRLCNLKGLHLCAASQQGLVGQVQASMALASTFGRRFILYVEPDKRLFFEHRLPAFLKAVPDHDRMGMTLASRTDGSFATFPPMQRYAERVINKLCAQTISRPGDYSYGPFVMPRTLLSHVATLDAGLGWGWRHAMFVAAHRAQLDVLHVADDHPCPPEQQHEDENARRHRLRQLSQNILGLVS